MIDEGDAPRTDDLVPSLGSVSCREDLAEVLNHLFARADVSIRGLEARTCEARTPLTRSTISDMLLGRRFPRKVVFTAFLRECGVPEAQLGPWTLAWQNIAGAEKRRPQGEGIDLDRLRERVLGEMREHAAEILDQAREQAREEAAAIIAEAREQAVTAARAAAVAAAREQTATIIDEARRMASSIITEAEHNARRMMSAAAVHAPPASVPPAIVPGQGIAGSPPVLSFPPGAGAGAQPPGPPVQPAWSAERDRLRAENAALRADFDAAMRKQILAGEPVTLTRLLGIDDPHAIDPAALWRPRSGADLLRVPVGVDAEGEVVALDIKESAQDGMGPHGLCIGATGSGKSELLRTLVLGLALTHSSEQLNLVLVDFKGGATFAGMERLSHVAAVITNLQDDLPLVDRMYAALEGELVRRQEHLRSSGNFASLRDYDKARRHKHDLPPMPTLFIVLDEFTELLTSKPEFADLFVMIGRIGRSLGVHLLLASQRLEEGKLRGLETHLSYRIGLRTFSAMESRVVLGAPDAYELPSAPGHGYMKVGTEPMAWFRAAFVSSPVSPAANSTAHPAAASSGETRAASGVETLFDVIIRRLEGHGPPARQIWLPPLDEPPTLDRLLPDLAVTPEHGLIAAHPDLRGRLTALAGVVDLPFEQKRVPYLLDLSGAAGNAGLVGGPQSGKSTLVRTLISSLALTHTPAEVQFYCLDFGGGTLRSFRDLPHVGGVANRLEADRVRRTVAEVVALLERREREFAERGIESIRAYRDLPDGDGRGDVFLVVDGWGTLRQDYEGLEPVITDLAARGLGYGVHVIASALKWSEFRLGIRDLFGTRVELKLGDPFESEIDRRVAAAVPANRPGRGLTRDRAHFLAALPRIDGGDHPLGTGPTGMINAVRDAWKGRPEALRVRMLPAVLPGSELPGPDGTGTRISIGIDEDALQPVHLDFSTDPHFLVVGDNECGKSNLLKLITQGVIDRHTPQEARMVFLDYRRSLLDHADTDHRIGYAASASAAASLVKDVAGALKDRLPPADLTPGQLRDRSWWSGADLYLVIDDYDLVATSSNPVTQLAELLPQARDIGLHVIVSRSSGGAGRGMYDPVLQRIKEMGSPGLLMSGNKDEGVLLGDLKGRPLPAGRGTLWERRRGARLIQTALVG
ncbi:type VII secretion protein EccCb [Spirillospora sp. NPDC047279]|uniref:type VII secretion protein EccCb n=1 Tax=Spirillospora sp. NPDC047279 TaxID=3155478 RepID=UPI0034118398